MSGAAESETFEDLVRRIARGFDRSTTPMLDARALVKHAAGFDDARLILEGRDVAPTAVAASVAAMAVRRAAGEPVSQIVGFKEFRSLRIGLRPGVLSPRADSEAVLDMLELRRDFDEALTILELGVGSGALLAAALTAYPRAFGVGVDCNPVAAGLARQNARALGLAARMACFAGDWTGAINARFDVVICNPPYIAATDRETLPADVVDFEDPRALFGGEDGLDAYRQVFTCLPDVLATSGLVIFELGAGQHRKVAALGRQAFRGARISYQCDLAGNRRALAADWRI